MGFVFGVSTLEDGMRNTEIAPIERAKQVLSFDETKAKLAELAVQSERIVEITNPAGYHEAQRARVELKSTRVDIQKRGKAAREDATAYSKAVIEAEKELIAVIEPEESRLQALQDAWDAAREAERQAKIDAERERVDTIQKRIAAIRALPAVAGRGSSQIEETLSIAEADIGDDFQEFTESAKAAQAEAIETLRGMIDAAKASEEAERVRIAEEHARAESMRIESERLAAERAELERLRAEQDERERIERAARDAELAAERAKIEAERAELRAAQEAQRKAEEDARLAEIERQREADRIARHEAEEKAKAEREARAAAEQERIAMVIANATLVESAREAVELLEDNGLGEHLVTRKLRAAIERHSDHDGVRSMSALEKIHEIQMQPAATPAHLLQMAVKPGRKLGSARKADATAGALGSERVAERRSLLRWRRSSPSRCVSSSRKQVSIPGGAKFSHATLADVVDAAVAGMGAHGLSHRWITSQSANEITVTCVVTHALGHSESTSLTCKPDDSGKKNAIQQVASAITYLERYTLQAALGIAASDMQEDDGRGTSHQVEMLSDEQQAQLQDLIDANGRDKAKFLQWAKVESLQRHTCIVVREVSHAAESAQAGSGWRQCLMHCR
jgi:hypothetical protein